MRIAALSRFLLCVLLVSSGCRSRSDLVEAELRTKDRMLREATAELDQARMINESLQHQFVQQHQGLPPVENSGLLPPKDITLARGTGGVSDDGIPGDEALQLVVVPRDEDGNSVRVVGTLYVTVWEIAPSGVKIPLSSWEVNSLDLRRTWRSGLLGSGYFVVLRWKKWPTQEKLRIAVQLGLADGRLYEADKDVSIRPPKGGVVPEERMPLLPSAPVPEPIRPPAPEAGPELPAWMLAPRPSIYGQESPVP